jgi:hypothetical protein
VATAPSPFLKQRRKRMMPPPKTPEQEAQSIVVVYDGEEIVLLDFANDAQVREIVQIIQKHKPITQ